MPTSFKYIPQYTVSDYQSWKGDWELIHGVAIAMGPSPYGPHQNLNFELTSILKDALRKCRLSEFQVLQEIDWVIDSDTVVRPDIVLFKGKIPAKHLTVTPIVIVEILSESTADKDRTIKKQIYQQCGVKYYLLADPASKKVEVYRLKGKRYVLQKESVAYRFELAPTRKLNMTFGRIL
jgi:Uma2 family endonuclease